MNPFREFDNEAWIIKRLGDLGRSIYDGNTSPYMRRERVRSAIVNGRLADLVIGNRSGTPETFAQAFERFYQEPLQRKPEKEKTDVNSASA